jgi:hypothetical protein
MNQQFVDRANRNLNLNDFSYPSLPICIESKKYNIPFERQYILRMMVRSPESDGLRIPEELEWLKDTIQGCDTLQKSMGLKNQYVYITVRHGIVTSETDDIWHVDGFSMRREHVPEQNYIWTNVEPTEYAEQAFPIPDDFDAMKHHLHWYLDEQVRQENIRQCEAGNIYLIDPYCVHRRPKQTAGIHRTFWRISFIPIEIEDNQCQQNPLMPKKIYSNEDIRKVLIRY